eukprot:1395132-Amorphochlora_amoeboformis.AAC.1
MLRGAGGIEMSDSSSHMRMGSWKNDHVKVAVRQVCPKGNGTILERNGPKPGRNRLNQILDVRIDILPRLVGQLFGTYYPQEPRQLFLRGMPGTLPPPGVVRRFSLLLLGEGEYYFRDYGGYLYLSEQGARSNFGTYLTDYNVQATTDSFFPVRFPATREGKYSRGEGRLHANI